MNKLPEIGQRVMVLDQANAGEYHAPGLDYYANCYPFGTIIDVESMVAIVQLDGCGKERTAFWFNEIHILG